MGTKNNGGPAFPIPGLQNDPDFNGMTLRDYFAAKAMPTMISMCQTGDGEWDAATVAQNAYAVADAMLDERAP